MIDEELYKEHTNREEHSWESNYFRFSNDLQIFAGITCECGAFIKSADLASIINNYQGNRIVPGHVMQYVQKGRRI